MPIAKITPEKLQEKLEESKARQARFKGNRKAKQKLALALWRKKRSTKALVEKRDTLDEQIEARARELLPKLLAKEREKLQKKLDKETRKQRAALLHTIKRRAYYLEVAREKIPEKIKDKTAQHLELMRAKVAEQKNSLIYIARHTLILFDIFTELNIYPPLGGFLAWAYQYEYFSVREFRIAFPGIEPGYYGLLKRARMYGFIRKIHMEGRLAQLTLTPEGKEYTRKLLKYMYKKTGFNMPESLRKKHKSPAHDNDPAEMS